MAENLIVKRISPSHADNRHVVVSLKRVQLEDGIFKTTAKLRRVENSLLDKKQVGLLHNAVALRHRVVGDIPTLSRQLKSLQPETKKGKAAKCAGLTGWKAVKGAGTATVVTALVAETVVTTTTRFVANAGIRKLKSKYHVEAQDDTNRALLETKRVKQDYKFEKHKYKKYDKTVSKIEKASVKQEKLQRKIIKKSKTTPIAIKPIKYIGRKGWETAKQKVKEADPNNDFITAGATKKAEEFKKKAKKEAKQEVKSQVVRRHSLELCPPRLDSSC